eukprot:TRINITY_DN5072_c0_g4_i2.p1 TRINITY_DN5072_c0_g4~~TRINITY_DN5072_c0_g4_i2.p1  ORF type:complete len:224 (-),score=12.28 TRINITY_DN5072_c0_g4_i2:289-885(-)
MLVERKKDSEKLAKEALEREIREASAVEESSDEVYDEEAEEEQFSKWKIRELARIKKAEVERADFEKDLAEVERRRTLSDDQIAEENKRLGIKQSEEKKKWAFLQKYYHKGVFYQDLPEFRERKDWDFDAGVGEDLVDKAALPSVMQTKNFGKRGRTKWKHLVAEDTTRAHHHIDHRLRGHSSTDESVSFDGYHKQFL